MMRDRSNFQCESNANNKCTRLTRAEFNFLVAQRLVKDLFILSVAFVVNFVMKEELVNLSLFGISRVPWMGQAVKRGGEMEMMRTKVDLKAANDNTYDANQTYNGIMLPHALIFRLFPKLLRNEH